MTHLRPTLTLSLLCLMAGAFLTNANPTKSIFPDPALEAAVRQQVFAKRNTKEPITAADVTTIPSIRAHGKGITDLTGLEHCHALMELDITNNAVSDLAPISGLERLQSLTVAKNKISDLTPVKDLSAMQFLDATHNQISDTSPLAGMSKLSSLYLSHNAITDTSGLGSLTKLWSLHLDGNKISDISGLKGLPRVDSLNLSGNQIEDLSPLSEWKQLAKLRLNSNKISSLDVLLKMAEADIADGKRFASFWKIDLRDNPLGPAAQAAIKKLEELGAKVSVDSEKSGV